MSPTEKANELYTKFQKLIPAQTHYALRKHIAIESAIATVGEIEKYSEHYFNDGFWNDVIKALNKIRNG